MTTKNPFPGMNPFFEQQWRDAHTMLIAYIRASHLGEREAYTISLRDRLPVISIPLRRTDADIPLELQPLIDQCHERGRYHRLRYRVELDPPFSPTDAAWVQETLRQHELL